MPDTQHEPDQCQSMADVRRGIDALDAEIVRLLARRFGYMRAAARIKPDRDQVRDEDRKASVIERARALSEEMGAPPQVIERLWESLVEASIDYELAEWDRLRGS